MHTTIFVQWTLYQEVSNCCWAPNFVLVIADLSQFGELVLRVGFLAPKIDNSEAKAVEKPKFCKVLASYGNL